MKPKPKLETPKPKPKDKVPGAKPLVYGPRVNPTKKSAKTKTKKGG